MKLLKTFALALVCGLLFVASDCSSPSAPIPERQAEFTVLADIKVEALATTPPSFLILFEDLSTPQDYHEVVWQLRFDNEIVRVVPTAPWGNGRFEVEDVGEYLLIQILQDEDGVTLARWEWNLKVGVP